MFYIIGIVGLVIALGVFALSIKAVKMTERQVNEWARQALHPTLIGQPLTITSYNVRDIIDATIEDGYDHPALARRKAGL